MIAYDCVHRKLEILERGLHEPVERTYLENNVVGFNTYGEQYHGVHINQTLAGVAIGGGADG